MAIYGQYQQDKRKPFSVMSELTIRFSRLSNFPPPYPLQNLSVAYGGV